MGNIPGSIHVVTSI